MKRLTDIVWKIVVGGSGGVGKTTFLHRYMTKQFLQDTRLTVGVAFQTHKLARQGKDISMVLWDLGGQERFRFIQGTYIKGAVAAFLMFDLSRMETLHELQDWVKLVRETVSSSVPIVLVGSKFDLISPEKIPAVCQEAEKFASDIHLTQFITISSKSGANVDETMDYMIDLLLWQKDQGIISESISQKELSRNRPPKSISQKVPSERDAIIAPSTMLVTPIRSGAGSLPRSSSEDRDHKQIIDTNHDRNRDTPFLGKV